MRDNTDELLLNTLGYYRSLGFYGNGNFRGVSDRELADLLKVWVRESSFGHFDPGSPWYDLQVLSFDQDRVWYIEDFMLLGKLDHYKDDFFGNVLYKLATISKGVFTPRRIRTEGEHYGWNTITFLDEEKEQTLELNADGDVLPLSLFEEINVVFAQKDYSFECFRHPNDYGEACVLLLSKEEKARLQRERGWHYTRSPSHWIKLAGEYSGRMDYEKVIQICEKAFATIEDPTEGNWYYLFWDYAYALEWLEEHEEALKWFERAESLVMPSTNTENVFEYSGEKIWMLIAMDRVDRALQFCDAALSKEPMQLYYLFAKARIYEELQNYAQALTIYQDLLQREPRADWVPGVQERLSNLLRVIPVQNVKEATDEHGEEQRVRG